MSFRITYVCADMNGFRAFFFICFCLLTTQGECQLYDYAMLIGGEKDDYGYSVQLNKFGLTCLASTRSVGEGSEDLWLIGLYVTGAINNFTTFGDAKHDYPSKLIKTADRSYGIICSPWGGGSGRMDASLLKVSPTFEKEWQQYYGGGHRDEALDGVETSDGGFLLCGMSKSGDPHKGYRFVIKTDSMGTAEWETQYPNTDNTKDFAYSALETSNGNFLISYVRNGFNHYSTFEFVDSSASSGMLLLDPQGDVIWDQYNQTSEHEILQQTLEVDGHFYSIGHSQNGEHGSFDILFEKRDSNGLIMFQKFFGGSGYEYGYDMVYADGYFYLVGATSSNSNDNTTDVIVLKVDRDGVADWQQSLGDASSEVGKGIIRASDTEFFVVGTTNHNGSQDVLCFKFDALGHLRPFTTKLNNHGVLVYPNPSDRHINFEILDDCENYILEIFTSTGQMVISATTQPPETTITISSKSLEPGVYQYRLTSDCQPTRASSFIVR